MCVEINQPKLNAGHDSNVEVVLLHTVPMVRQDGVLREFDKSSSAIKTAFYSLYLLDARKRPEMMVALERMGVEKPSYFVQYLICNFGGDNEIPDFDAETGIFHKEYWDCGQKHSCPGFGCVCRGDISCREFDIIKLFKEGLPDKLIASALNISENTIRSHRRILFKNLGAHNKQEAILNASKQSVIF